MAPIELTAVITPKTPEKSARFLELFQKCVDYVQANERDYVHRYELHKGIKEQNGGKEQFVVLEGMSNEIPNRDKADNTRYKDKEGMDKHMATAPVVSLIDAITKEDLTETQLILTTKGPGISPKL